MLSSSYQNPKICCRCGERPAALLRPIHNSQLGGFGYYGLCMTVRRNNYSFNVPVCLDCSDKLDSSDMHIKTARIAFSILFSLGFLYAFAVSGYFLMGIITSIMIYIALHLTFHNRPITRHGLGGFTGRYFWFSNMKFFKQFASLNPNLVSPNDYRLFFPATTESNSTPEKKRNAFPPQI